MRNREANQHKDRLDDLFKQVSEVSDINLQGHWARYLCVLVSGFIEVSIRAILTEYVKNKSAPSVANYVVRGLDRFQNPNMERILQTLGAFNPAWADEISKLTEGELKDAVDSVIANRNNIAHGGNVSIRYRTIASYYDNAVKVIEIIEEQCDPS